MLLLFFSGAANNIAAPVGVEALGQTGVVGTSVRIGALLTGVEARGEAGLVAIPHDEITPVTGVQALGSINGVLVWGQIMSRPSEIWTEVVPKEFF